MSSSWPVTNRMYSASMLPIITELLYRTARSEAIFIKQLKIALKVTAEGDKGEDFT